MRMQQQQPLSQQTQQRQPILMGMQPQTSGPGKVMHFFFVIVELYIRCTEIDSYYSSHNFSPVASA
jgi:hypothetical protein